MGQEQGQATSGTAQQTSKIKVAMMGSETKYVEVQPGMTVEAVCRQAGFNIVDRQLRVDGRPVEKTYVMKGTESMVSVGQRVAAGDG
ncbi:MAG: hypothetical protein V1723_01440 [Candidatus Uhrbacteria bacterium]